MTEESTPVTQTDRPEKKRTPKNPGYQLAAHAVDAMLDKKAHDVVVIDLRGISGVAEFFVLGTGDSDLQVRAIANSERDRIREQCDERVWHKEGLDRLEWVLLDYVDCVVHIFSKAKREHYDLERLWGEAPSERIPEDGSAADVELLEAPRQAPRRASNA